MLPFMKIRRQDAGQMVEMRKPDEKSDPKPDAPDDGLEAAMGDLSQALASKNHREAAAAFRAAFQILESQPHEESNE